MKNRKKKRRLPKRVRRMLAAGAAGFVLLGTLVFGILFYPSHVEVVGNTRYTEAEIRDMAMTGPLSLNTLLFAHFNEHISLEHIAFMESVDVEYLNHNTIRLHVSEKYPIGYVAYEGSWYYFDKDGMVLESRTAPAGQDGSEAETRPEEDGQAKETEPGGSPDAKEPSAKTGGNGTQEAGADVQQVWEGDSLPAEEAGEEEAEGSAFVAELDGVPEIRGLSFQSVRVGEKLPLADDSILNSILGVSKMLDKFSITADCVEVTGEEELVLYQGNVRVLLGKDENLEEKMSRAAAILPKLTGESGQLHLEDFTEETQNIIFERDQT